MAPAHTAETDRPHADPAQSTQLGWGTEMGLQKGPGDWSPQQVWAGKKGSKRVPTGLLPPTHRHPDLVPPEPRPYLDGVEAPAPCSRRGGVGSTGAAVPPPQLLGLPPEPEHGQAPPGALGGPRPRTQTGYCCVRVVYVCKDSSRQSDSGPDVEGEARVVSPQTEAVAAHAEAGSFLCRRQGAGGGAVGLAQHPQAFGGQLVARAKEAALLAAAKAQATKRRFPSLTEAGTEAQGRDVPKPHSRPSPRPGSVPKTGLQTRKPSTRTDDADRLQRGLGGAKGSVAARTQRSSRNRAGQEDPKLCPSNPALGTQGQPEAPRSGRTWRPRPLLRAGHSGSCSPSPIRGAASLRSAPNLARSAARGSGLGHLQRRRRAGRPGESAGPWRAPAVTAVGRYPEDYSSRRASRAGPPRASGPTVPRGPMGTVVRARDSQRRVRPGRAVAAGSRPGATLRRRRRAGAGRGRGRAGPGGSGAWRLRHSAREAVGAEAGGRRGARPPSGGRSCGSAGAGERARGRAGRGDGGGAARCGGESRRPGGLRPERGPGGQRLSPPGPAGLGAGISLLPRRRLRHWPETGLGWGRSLEVTGGALGLRVPGRPARCCERRGRPRPLSALERPYSGRRPGPAALGDVPAVPACLHHRGARGSA
ncbi:PREDICTED: collagen alpha-1(I) chain-like [Ceratotherium simum simum]|uniref:Collagen alpha-1(I) chain-like n=1 Tax=Ceratotherium simum simum TaxID=73337 RepID=A0ABM1DAS3_CERSS|nr:PREDICTED: collagen alpha-1(I) chain-like [Ceratotherium simum simum]